MFPVHTGINRSVGAESAMNAYVPCIHRDKIQNYYKPPSGGFFMSGENNA